MPLLYVYAMLAALMWWCLCQNIKWLRSSVTVEPIILLFLDAASLSLLVYILVVLPGRRLRDRGRIVPYFKKPNSGALSAGSFLSGEAIAANCEELDHLAIRCNVLPVSRFGFNDDWYCEKLEWHDPADGLRTIRALKEAIAPSDSAWPRDGKETLISELGKLEVALENALAQAVPFCLLFRLSEGMSGPQADSREGSF